MTTLERLLIGLVLWAGSLGAAVWWGMDVGENKILADAAREERIGRVAYAAANSAAASAIARIEVKNVYTRQELEREVRTNTVFADCRSGDAAVRLLNATAGVDQARAFAPGGGVVPASGASH
jgi:hypothetical protein